MFDQTFVNTHAQARRPWTLAASFVLQTGLVAAMVIVPMLHPEVLHPKFDVPIWVPLKPPVTKPEPVTKSVERAANAVPRPTAAPPLSAPTRIPNKISMAADAPEFADPMMTGPGFPAGASFITGITQALPERAPQPAPVVKREPAPPAGPVHVSTGVQSAKLIFGPRPQYPSIAKTARVQGTVKIQAIIATDGNIRNLQVMSGPPLLVNIALEAVKQWRYQPTLLNGNAVEVITEIDVVFTLSQ